MQAKTPPEYIAVVVFLTFLEKILNRENTNITSPAYRSICNRETSF